ncbi:MAG: nodulation protein NfeD [Bdellovibrio sp.]|nr:nodulation protein NfeD [Bdellovibrio sp.]
MRNLSAFVYLVLALWNLLSPPALLSSEGERILEIKRILELEINSSINPATLNYLDNAFKVAHNDSHELILIKINTPGGLISTTKDILTLIGRSELPIVIWVTPEGASATSAGAIIASGAHLLFMSDGTNIGAATPVELGKDLDSKDLRSKAVNDLVALVEGLATARHRNSQLFAKMVSEASSFPASEAKKNGLIDGITNSIKELCLALNKRSIEIQGKKFILEATDPVITKYEMDFGQKLLNILANPQLAYILFILGMALLYFEMQAPGGFLAGSIGAIFLLFAAIGFQVLPVNWGGMGLILLSFILFLLEIWITSYGLLSIAGLAALITGSLFLFRTDNAYIQLGTGVILSIALAIGSFLALMGYFLFRDWKKNKKHIAHFNDLRGAEGVILEVRDKTTEGLFCYSLKANGEIWNGLSQNPHKVGDKVKIISQRADDLFVEF